MAQENTQDSVATSPSPLASPVVSPSPEASPNPEAIPSLMASPSPVVESQDADKIFSKTRNTQKIAELRLLYRDQIEVYRKSDKAFNIAKTHYFNVLTLVSLEELVAANQKAMDDRLNVMITYLDLIGTTLEDTSGVEIKLKTESLSQINEMIVNLKLHKDKVAVSRDRALLNETADEFALMVKPYEYVSYRALSLIRIGQMQLVYDAAFIIDADIKKIKESEDVGAVVKSKRARAFQEIQRNFTITNEGLAELNDKIIFGVQESFGSSFYEKTLDGLQPIYIQMSKSLDHLTELLKL
ncbi:hypothetical protein KA089_01460 [Candidatus Woesebacteria bacterium]|nr:hypothetical protein [Candidatus Woesebacteria bacterium]